MTQDSTQIATQLSAVLDELGKRFGATGVHLWEVLVRQVTVDAWGYGGGAVLLLLVAITLGAISVALLRRSKRPLEKGENEYRHSGDAEDYRNLHLATAGAGIAVLLLTFFPLFSFVGRLLNPEYYALAKVLVGLQ